MFYSLYLKFYYNYYILLMKDLISPHLTLHLINCKDEFLLLLN